jgi:hypothetical protein
VPGVAIEEIECLAHPRIEAALHVARYFAHDVFAA